MLPIAVVQLKGVSPGRKVDNNYEKFLPLLDSDRNHRDVRLRSNASVFDVSKGLPLHRNQDQVVLFCRAKMSEDSNSAIGTPFAASNRQRRNGLTILEGLQLTQHYSTLSRTLHTKEAGI